MAINSRLLNEGEHVTTYTFTNRRSVAAELDRQAGHCADDGA